MNPLTQLENLPSLQLELDRLDPEHRLARLELRRVTVSPTAHLEVAEALSEVLPATLVHPRICMITDTTPIRRAGQLLVDVVRQQLEPACEIHHERLCSGHGGLHADEAALAQASSAARGHDAIITIGSGTITDIGKVAGARNGGLVHVALQTAASVDGFTDNVSVVLKSGVKRTITSAWPSIVLADVETIAGAPREMNIAGFGEALSLFTAPADWYLSHVLGLDKTYHPASMTMLKAAAAQPPDWSAGIAQADKSATAKLTRLLALRGIISGVSNTTACLSGVEHVISHMLDLHHATNHAPIGLHGEQVGLASVIAARLWRQAVDSEIFDPARLSVPDTEAMRQRIFKAFGHLDTDDRLAGECWRDCQVKLGLLASNWPALVDLITNWQERKQQFASLVIPAETMAATLAASGAPIRFSQLRQSVSGELALWAVMNCHLMRNRFNLIDLLDLMGLWTVDRIHWAMHGLIGDDP